MTRLPNRWTLILRARRIRRLMAELSEAATKTQLTPAEVNIIEAASKGLYQLEFILSVSPRRATGFASRMKTSHLVPLTNDNSPTE